MRTVSSTLRSALYALTTDEGLLAFITVEHPTAFSDFFFTSDSIQRTHPPGVDLFDPGLPEWRFPPDAEDEEAIVSLSLEAVSVKGRLLLAALRGLQDELGTVKMDFRRLKDTSLLEASLSLSIGSVRYDQSKVTLELVLDGFLDETYGLDFTPDIFPALFQ